MIGDKIYQFRKNKGLSQEEFANSIGVTRQIVSKWESNQSVPGVDKLKKISDVYNITYSELLSGTSYGSKKWYDIKKYIFLVVLMVIFQIIFIVIISMISSRNMESEYRCLGTQTYIVLEVYDSEDDNYSYITLKKGDDIRTVKVSKVISSMVVEGNEYQFIFRSNEDNSDIDYIFNNNEIINVIDSDYYKDDIVCK